MHNARVAAVELLEGSSEWLDWVIALFIKLPLYLLWTLTVGVLLLCAWKVFMFVLRRLRGAKAAQPAFIGQA
jgi:hypothetical protein